MTNVKIYISGAQGPAGDAPSGFASSIHDATAKTTPADLDELALLDSATSFSLKKLTWASLKTALSTALQSVFYTETETNTLLNAKANLAGGNTFTGTQTLNVGAFKDTTTTNTSSISVTADTLNANRTVTLPNASGVLALTANANGSTSDIELYAKAGLAINAAQVVYITGASGANVIIGLAQANGEATSTKTIGICKQNLANNGFGYVVTEGNLTGISVAASGAVEGDPVFLSPSTPGGMVFGLANKPSAPNHLVYLGVVKTVAGSNVTAIYVKVQNGFELDELHDVAISSPTNGQTIFRNGSNLWVNRAIVSADISNATSAATANTVVKRDATGGGVYFGSSASDFGVAGASGSSFGAYGESVSGSGLGGNSTSGSGVSANSSTGTGLDVSTATGTYHALFGNTGSDRSFIALVNGAFGWFRGIYTGRIQAPTTLAANVTWTLPTTGGTLPTLPPYANLVDASAALPVSGFWWDTTLREIRGPEAISVPYYKSSGNQTLIPFDVAGSNVKQSGTKYWAEVGRVKIPASAIVSGSTIALDVRLKTTSLVAIPSLARTAILVPTQIWDYSPQSQFFGASPSSSTLNTTSPSFFPFRFATALSLNTAMRLQRSHVISISSGVVTAGNADAGTYGYGWDYTSSAAFTDTQNLGWTTGINLVDREDLEFVIVVNAPSDSGDYREVYYDVNITVTPATA
jgi:hypothetical protein